MRFQVCTIITRSYLAQARVLYDSFRRFHPDIPFTALMFDARRGEVNEPFNTLYLEDIGLPVGEEARMPMLYNVTELATALKPWLFRRVLSAEKTELLYFDPDIEVFAPLDRLAELAAKHCLVMTPHTTQPMSRDDVKPNETDILSAGTYNLGFLGLNSNCERFLDWWGERLLREAVIDIPNMRFTDQRWMDFAPGYFDTHILRDETCNVAYWNADSRPLNWNGTGYEVDGRPLCFFHFSGFNPDNPYLLSVHQHTNPRTRLSTQPALVQLCSAYTEKLMAAGYNELRKTPYGWGETPDGLKITDEMRLAYRTALRDHEEKGEPPPPSPFAAPRTFIDWLNEPLRPRRCPEMTRYFLALYDARPDFRALFPDLLSTNHHRYYEWLRDYGRREIPIPNELFPPVPANSVTTEEPNEAAIPLRGVTLTGYLRAEAGTGEAGRLMKMALEKTGEKQAVQVWTDDVPSRQNHPWNERSTAAALGHRYDINLICINADQLPAFARELGPQFFRNRYNIGLWFWELDTFPATMHSSFDYLHEVWVSSEFTRSAIARHSPVPVFTIPFPVNVDATAPSTISRAQLELPDAFLYLFSFDFFSVAQRKNAVGAINAFRQAFSPNEGPVLVIKSINGDRNLAEMERLYHARGDRSDILIRDGYLDAAERDALMMMCDCYVSLHRSEGFGLTMAETMLLEKPVIATRYSGNLEFMNDSNSFLCGYTLTPVGRGQAPYPPEARWAEPNIAEAAELMRLVYTNPEEARRRGQQARRDLCAHHSPAVAAEFIKNRLGELRQSDPAPVPSIASDAERPFVTRLRLAIEMGINVRRTVPSLLNWIFRGPRRAMKQFLRNYELHRRQVDLHTVNAIREIDAETIRAREALLRRIFVQEDELLALKHELNETRQRLSALENENGEQMPASEQIVTEQSPAGREIRRKSGLTDRPFP